MVSGPASEPVTVDELKLHARLDAPYEGDGYLEALISSARDFISRRTGRALITETWKLTLDVWPCAGEGSDDWWDGIREAPITILEAPEIEIRKAPFLAVTKVATLDEAGAETEWDSANYYAAAEHGFGRLIKRRGAVWPVLQRDRAGIVITFTAGYGSNASDVPMGLRQAVKMLAAHWYENREPATPGGMSEPPHHVSALLRQFTVGH